MKDAIILLILLNANATKVCSLPYQADSNGACHNPKTEYQLDDGSNLCCSKCPPGQRLVKACFEATDSVCEPCMRDQYIENWNFSPNCFPCLKCKPSKGLQHAQNCSSSIMSMCVCQPGKYCIMEFDAPYCAECMKYTSCKPGQGVSVQGTADSNVRCAPCRDGTFSNKISYTDSCQPHTNCQGRAVVRKGSATSDTVCKSVVFSSTTLPQSPPNEPQERIVHTTASTMTTTTSPSLDSRLSARSSVSEAMINHPTKTPQGTDIKAVAAIASVIGLILLFIIILVLLVQCKAKQKKEAERFHPDIDANGNCERDDKINQDYSADTQLTSFTVNSPEQQSLLETREPCCILSPSSNDAERMEGCSSRGCESIGAFQSTTALHSPHSTLSEPMPLLSNTEPVSSQPNIPPQSPSQPTSPQLISPVAASPHVNVNITFHIGNGSCGTTSIIPADSVHTGPDLPVGEEEECFSMPQQEAGKQSLMAVQECVSYNG